MTKCLCGEVLTATVNINRDVPSIVLSALFESLFSALFIGLIVWRLQKRYEESENKKEIYNKRIIDIEEKFFENIRIAKNGLYTLETLLSNQGSAQLHNISIAGKTINNALGTAFMLCRNTPVVLAKYQNYVERGACIYNKIIDYLQPPDNNPNSINIYEINRTLKKLELLFDDIDRIYYGLEPKKREKRTRNKNQKIMRKKGQHD